MKELKAVNLYHNVLLCSARVIKSESVINDNVEEGTIMSTLRYVQDIQLTNIIGKKLVWRLQELVATTGIKEDEYIHYKVLLDDYITPYLVHMTVAELIPIISLKIRNKGLIKTSDEHLEVASFREMMSMREIYRQKADSYANNLKKFLCKNHSLYHNELSKDDGNYNLMPHFPCPIFLD